MRRWAILIPLLVAAGLLAGWQGGQTKHYSADRFDVEVTVLPDGSARVAETVTLNFQGGPFTYAFREIPTRRADGITDFALTEDGRAYPPGAGEGQLEIRKRGDEWRLRGRFRLLGFGLIGVSVLVMGLAGDLASANVGAMSGWFAASSASAGAAGGAVGATGGGAGGGASGAG